MASPTAKATLLNEGVGRAPLLSRWRVADFGAIALVVLGLGTGCLPASNFMKQCDDDVDCAGRVGDASLVCAVPAGDAVKRCIVVDGGGGPELDGGGSSGTDEPTDGGLLPDGGGIGGDGGGELTACGSRTLGGPYDVASPQTAADVRFGASLLVDGEYLYVGAPGLQEDGRLNHHGAVYKYACGVGGCSGEPVAVLPPVTGTQTLTTNTGGMATFEIGWGAWVTDFGFTQARAGSLLAVGARYVYPQEAYLALSLDGDVDAGNHDIVVTPGNGNAAIVYRDGDSGPEQVLACGDSTATDIPPGGDVDVVDVGSYELVAVGSLIDAGKVCIFSRTGDGSSGAWSNVQVIGAPDETTRFGSKVRFSQEGDVLLVRAENSSGSGRLYSYTRNPDDADFQPGQRVVLFEDGFASTTDFELATRLGEPYSVIGSKNMYGGGYVFVHDLDGGIPTLSGRALAEPEEPGEMLGSVVAARDDLVAVGSRVASPSSKRNLFHLYEFESSTWHPACSIDVSAPNIPELALPQLSIGEFGVVTSTPHLSAGAYADVGKVTVFPFAE